MRKIIAFLAMLLIAQFNFNLLAQNLTEGFENQSNFPPEGWEVIYGDGNPDVNTVNQSGSEHYQGLFSFEFRSSATTEVYDQYLITPELIVSEGDQVFSFYYKKGSNSTESFRIGWSSTGQAITDFSWSDDVTNADINWQEYLITDLPVETKYVAIHYKSINKFNLYVDAVFGPALASWNPPHCAQYPSPNDQATEVHAATSLSWSKNYYGGYPSGYKLYFGTNNPPTNMEYGTDLGNTTTYNPAVNLAFNTTYYWSVVPYNSDGEPNDCPVWSFTTMSDPTVTSFPYRQAFESEIFPPSGWHEVRTPASYQGWESYDHGLLEKCARFDSRFNADGNVSRLITPPMDLSGLSTAQLIFNYKNPGGGDFSVLLSTDGGLSYPHTLFTNLTAQPNWTELTADISTYVGSTITIAFQGTSNKANYARAYIDLDEITIEQIPTCTAPTALTASNLTIHSADLGWTENGSATTWQIEYKANADFTPGTGAAESIEVTNNPSFSLTGLASSTTYYWYVKAKCGIDDDSYWVGPGIFTTEFGPKTTPYFEGFEIGNTNDEIIANQWDQAPETQEKYSMWRAFNNAHSFNRSPRTGDWNAVLDNVNEQWMFQRISLVDGQEYTFDMYANHARHDGEQRNSSITVKYGFNPIVVAMTETIVETTILNEDYQLITGTFIPGVSGDYYIGIFGITNNHFNISIDDIAIYETPDCPAPLALNESQITINSARLGWTERGVATTWNIKYGTSDFNPANTGEGNLITGVTENPYTLTGLAEHTTYYWYVKADCGSEQSTWVGPYTFTTLKRTSVPYVQGFETTATPEDWTIEGWTIGTTSSYNIPPHDGNYIYTYLNQANPLKVFTTSIIGPVSDLMYLSFDYAHKFPSGPSAHGGEIVVSVSSDYGQTYTVVETIENTTLRDWQLKSIPINGYGGKDLKIKIEGTVNYWDYHLALDNLNLTSCPAPRELTTSNIRGNTAGLGWTEMGSAAAWNIKYGVTGFNPDTEGKRFTGISENPYTLSGLLKETTYDWYVQAACGEADESVWVGPHTFTTVATPMGTPYFEGFEFGQNDQNTVANGWTQQSISGNKSWVANRSYHTFGRSPRTGSWNATLEYSNRDWLFQKLYLEGGKSYTFDMYGRIHNDNMGITTLTIMYGSEANAASMEHEIAYKIIKAGAYQLVTGTFTPESTGIYTIGIQGKTIGYFTYISIDDIAIYETPDCPAPFESSVSNVTGNTADISWSPRGSETAWNIKYGPEGFNPANAEEGMLITGVATYPYILTGLTGKTQYDLYVQAACSDISQSAWTGPTSFTTGNEYYSIDYVEGFETGHTTLQPPANDWRQESVNGEGNWIANNYNAGANRHPRTGNWYAYLTDQNTTWMFQKVMLKANTDYTFELYARQNTAETSEMRIAVSYGAASTAAAMTNEIVDTTNITNGDYQLITGNFRPATAGIYSIGILGINNTYSYTEVYYLTIDDIAIYETLACPAPYALSVSTITPGSATLGWTERGSASNWNIKYGAPGFNPANAVEGTLISNVNANAYVLSGLQPNTTYDWYVQAACSDEETSTWTGRKPFTTKHLTAAPYTQEFTTTSTPDGWTKDHWFIETVSQTPVLDGNYIICNLWSSSFLRTFEMINIGPISADMALSFYYSHINNGGSQESPGPGSGGFEISISTDYGATYSVLETVNNNTSADWQYKEISISGYAGKDLKIKVTGIYNNGDFYLALDKISISVPPTCLAPLKLTESNITASSAELGWTEYGTANTYNVKYGIAGFNPATEGDSMVVNTTSYSLTNLEQNTVYDWYVQAACSASDASAWTGPKSFATDCGSASIPYFESFDAETAPALPSCMSEINANEDYQKWKTQSAYALSTPNAACILFNGSKPMNDWLFTQGLILEAGKTYELGFAYGSSENYQEKLAVHWGTEASVEGMTEVIFGNLETYGREWHTKAAILIPGTSGTYYIGFKGQSDADQYLLYVDDIYVVEQVAAASWTGALDNNWNNPGNWSTGVPGSITEVIIPAGLTNYPTISSSARCNDILLQSNAGGTASLLGNEFLTVNGTASVERYITGGWDDWNTGWHQISSPVWGQHIPYFIAAPEDQYDFYGWDESTNMWMNRKAGNFNNWNFSSAFNIGQGYLISLQAAASTKTFTGELITDDLGIYDLSKTDDMGGGWHLLGNPFVSALKWNDGNWALNNVAGVAKIWSEANKSYSDIEANGIIPSAQGFMVQVSDATNEITIPVASRVHNNRAFYKSGSANDRILLVAAETEGGSAQESKIIINPKATEGFDFEYDSRFISGYAPMLYSVVGDEILSTNSLPPLAFDKEIPFGFVKNAASAFTIQLKESIPGAVVYLTDIQTSTVTNLTETPVYSFTSMEGDDANRFLVSFATLGLDQPANYEGTNAYAFDDVIYIETPSQDPGSINVYNISGQLVLQGKTSGNTHTTLNASALRTGIYVVQIVLNDRIVSHKVVVNN